MNRTANESGAAPTPPTAPPNRGRNGASSGGAIGVDFGGGDSFGHHQIRDIKRGEGQSAVKTAAYITGESMFDSRLGLTFGRPEKSGRVLGFGTVGPKGADWTPAQIWGGAEKAEVKSNARTAQERVLALPHELDEATQKRLLNGYSLWLRDEYGVASTWALHAPSHRGDQRNAHGHIMTTTRIVTMDAEGCPVFGAKVRALAGNRDAVATEIEKQRSEWAKRVNSELERAGSSRRLDHRSHARRAEEGNAPKGLLAGQHKGKRAEALERRDAALSRAARAAEATRKAHNAILWRHWQRAERAAQESVEAILDAAAGVSAYDERKAAADAKWNEKQRKDWERWRKRQQQEEDDDRDSGR